MSGWSTKHVTSVALRTVEADQVVASNGDWCWPMSQFDFECLRGSRKDRDIRYVGRALNSAISGQPVMFEYHEQDGVIHVFVDLQLGSDMFARATESQHENEGG